MNYLLLHLEGSFLFKINLDGPITWKYALWGVKNVLKITSTTLRSICRTEVDDEKYTHFGTIHFAIFHRLFGLAMANLYQFYMMLLWSLWHLLERNGGFDRAAATLPPFCGKEGPSNVTIYRPVLSTKFRTLAKWDFIMVR